MSKQQVVLVGLHIDYGEIPIKYRNQRNQLSSTYKSLMIVMQVTVDNTVNVWGFPAVKRFAGKSYVVPQ